MTKDVHSKVSHILTMGMVVDPTSQTVYDVYDNILRAVSPLSNYAEHGTLLSEDTLKLFLSSFDYRSDSYANDVARFCSKMPTVVKEFARADDKQLIAVTAILLYIQSTDICNETCNKLINDIINLSSDNSCDIVSQINTTAAMLSSNVVGQQSLELDAKLQTSALISAFGNLLGAECIGRSSASNVAVPECHMKSMQELGLDVSKFLEMNQRIVHGKPISSFEIISLIDALKLDTSSIDFESVKPTIYDIMNIRFCWSFRWIFQWILETPSDSTGGLILDTVIGCLLETDKKFIEFGYSYLTLIEILLNCLYAMVLGLQGSLGYQQKYAYYSVIRATNLIRRSQPSSLLDVSLIKDTDKLQAIYRQVDELQKKLITSLKGLGFVEPLGKDSIKQSLVESLAQTNQSTDSTLGSLYQEVGCDVQKLVGALEQLKHAEQSENIQDVTKLLCESTELSTTLYHALENDMTVLMFAEKSRTNKR